MKLHGMFMIIPLLAVVASGSTIPSTDSYNVQRLEKRGNDDPASKKSGAKDPRVELAAGSGVKGGAQSKVSNRYLGVTEKPKGLDEQQAQARAQIKSDIDKNRRERLVKLSNPFGDPDSPSPIGNKDEKGNPVGSTNPFDSNYRPPHFGNKDKKKTPVESLNALESGHTSQTIVKENEKGESTKSPNSLKLGQRLRGIFNKNRKKKPTESLSSLQLGHTPKPIVNEDEKKKPTKSPNDLQLGYTSQTIVVEDEKEKPTESLNPFGDPDSLSPIDDEGEKEDPTGSTNPFDSNYRPPHFGNEDKKENPVGSLDSSAKNYNVEYEMTKDQLDVMRTSNQELVNKQDENPSGDASNKKLSETQAQADVQHSGIPKVKSVSVGSILSLFKTSYGRSRGTKTGPEQVDNDQQRGSSTPKIRIPVKKGLGKSQEEILMNQPNLGSTGAAYKLTKKKGVTPKEIIHVENVEGTNPGNLQNTPQSAKPNNPPPKGFGRKLRLLLKLDR
ncbi:hypothetical protein BASA61_004485 [Batrachochytrium salamandrivorans]|nr:hypothetical protein BASA62_004827 [Batrachochytrium salamandrivorans]KAH6592684.1 hypothetical protein BASA61_004485 [Batrachochytrium salamandrivorans]